MTTEHQFPHPKDPQCHCVRCRPLERLCGCPQCQALSNVPHESGGTPHWIVGARYWESDFLAIIYVTHRWPKHVYGYHLGYGHNVYVAVENVFPTPDEAHEETLRRRAEYNAELDAKVEGIIEKLLGKEDDTVAS